MLRESRMTVVRGAVVGLLLSMTASVGAQEEALDLSTCAFPDAPNVPDGNTASSAEMGDTGAAVRAFVTEGQDQLKCLEKMQAGLGEEITDTQRLQITDTYNAGVDQLNAVAGAYNEAVRSFRAKNPE